MSKGKRIIGLKTKIISATATVMFSLSSLFAGTLAWYSSNASVSVSGAMVNVATSNYALESVDLYKFNYAKDIIDENNSLFLNPEKGGVGRYFYEIENDHFIDHEENVTSKMNLYDPLERIISGDSFNLTQFNCNVVYEIVISTPANISSANFDVSSFLKVAREERDNNLFYLSDYVDFDVFTLDDIADEINGNPNPNLYDNGGNKKYLPSGYSCPLELADGSIEQQNRDPLNNEGEVGDFFLNTETNDFFVKESTGWVKQTNVLSAVGAPTNAEVADYYINTYNHDLYKYQNGTWGSPLNPASYSSGSGLPNENTGNINAIYLDTDSAAVYVKESSGWSKRSNLFNEELYYKTSYLSSQKNSHSHFYGLEDDTIALNPLNTVYYKGNNGWETISPDLVEMIVPKNNVGDIGDCYLDAGDYEIFIKDTTGWVLEHVTKSSGNPNGVIEGELGDYYVDISDNQTIYSYVEDMSPWKKVNVRFAEDHVPWEHNFKDVIVNNGDYYLNTSTKKLYICTARSATSLQSSWNEQTLTYDSVNPNMGIKYLDEENPWLHDFGDAHVNNGDLYLNTSSGIAYMCLDKTALDEQTNWSAKTVTYSINNPNYVSGSEGDYFIDTSNVNTYYTYIFDKDNNPWKVINSNFSGNGAPDNNYGSIDNVYLDESNGDIYVKENTGWLNRNASICQGLPSDDVGEIGDYSIDISSVSRSTAFYSSDDPLDMKKYTKIYVNVNYAPTQLEQYSQDLNEKIRALVDFAFSFSFSEVNS